MDVFRGGVMIADWSEPRTIEIIPMKQLAEIRLTMTSPGSPPNESEYEALQITKAALNDRKVFFQEKSSFLGEKVLVIPTFKTGDPINFLRYALGMRVLLQDRYVASFSMN